MHHDSSIDKKTNSVCYRTQQTLYKAYRELEYIKPSPPHFTHVTSIEWLVMENKHVCVEAFHTRMLLSLEPLQKRSDGNALCAGSQA